MGERRAAKSPSESVNLKGAASSALYGTSLKMKSQLRSEELKMPTGSLPWGMQSLHEPDNELWIR